MPWSVGLLDQHFNSISDDEGRGHCNHDADQGNEDVIPVRCVIVLAETNFSGLLLHTEIQRINGFPNLKRAA